MPHRPVAVARPCRALALALLASAAAVLTAGPLAAAAGALTGDGLDPDLTDPVGDVEDVVDGAVDDVEDTVDDVEETVDDVLDEATETVTSAPETVTRTVEDAATTATDLVDDLESEDAVGTAEPEPGDGPTERPGEPGPAGASGGSGTAGTQSGGDGAPAPPQAATEAATDEGEATAAPRLAGQPAGGFALVGLRSMLGSAPPAATDVPPPLVSEPETVAPPVIAGQEQLASVRAAQPPAGGGGWLAGAPAHTGEAGVPTPLAVTAGGLVLLVASAHALHAAGYLRPSFVKAAGSQPN